jgi:hypothetical protein
MKLADPNACTGWGSFLMQFRWLVSVTSYDSIQFEEENNMGRRGYVKSVFPANHSLKVISFRY